VEVPPNGLPMEAPMRRHLRIGGSDATTHRPGFVQALRSESEPPTRTKKLPISSMPNVAWTDVISCGLFEITHTRLHLSRPEGMMGWVRTHGKPTHEGNSIRMAPPRSADLLTRKDHRAANQDCACVQVNACGGCNNEPGRHQR
jgi:hypothetical protein